LTLHFIAAFEQFVRIPGIISADKGDLIAVHDLNCSCVRGISLSFFERILCDYASYGM
jgi:hypothetical protein